MTFLTAAEIAEATGGRPEHGFESNTAALTGVSIDSRTIAPGEVFVAIKGDRHDGHDYLAQASERGAGLLVVTDPGRAEACGVPVLVVRDAVRGLADLSQYWRRRLTGTRVVAVTGSNGKTTTCRLLDAVLGASMPGIASRRSFNNHIGLPLTLLSARPEHRYVVCELGTSNPGEIAALAAIAEPDVAVITSVGRAHLERLGDLTGVASEKAGILNGLRPGGVAFVTADSEFLNRELDGRPAVVRFGISPDADIRLTHTEHTAGGVRFVLDDADAFEAPLLGQHNALNAAAAVAVARHLGLNDDAIRRGLMRTRPVEMRLERSTTGPIQVFNDAYNANPDSMLAAIATLLGVASDADRRVVIVGDMLELGPGAEAAHEAIGAAIADSRGIGLAVCVGPSMAAAVRRMRAGGLRDVHHFESADGDGAAEIAALLRPGDAVLLKASRGVGLERVAHAIEGRWAGESPTRSSG